MFDSNLIKFRCRLFQNLILGAIATYDTLLSKMVLEIMSALIYYKLSQFSIHYVVGILYTIYILQPHPVDKTYLDVIHVNMEVTTKNKTFDARNEVAPLQPSFDL